MEVEDFEVEFDSPSTGIILRDYQERQRQQIHKAWADGYGRVLAEGATGTGKTTLFAAIARDNYNAGGKTLIIVNRERLVNQAAGRIRKETGLEVDIEMAGQHASPHSSIVVASVQTLMRVGRLTGFSDDHFSFVIADECHHSLAAGWRRILCYFHFGAQSLAEDWLMPEPGIPYEMKALILGVTATPDDDLGEIFQYAIDPYLLLQAVSDGWLVKPTMKSMALKIDLKGLRTGRSTNGSDFKPEDISEKLIPVIEALAQQIAEHASDRKTVAFTPSVECARMLADAVERQGLRGIFVSGECLDVDEKTEAFVTAGTGTVLCNCALYVEGADFPDVNCVVVARATKSRGFYRQMVGRGTRVLPGVVDGLPTPAERRAAIAASAKPDLLILDPLWIHERIEICEAYDLVTDKPAVKEAMKSAANPDLEEGERQAERDMLAALAKEARKHARKAAKTIDPLALAVSLGDAALANYVPENKWESEKPTPGQLQFIEKQGMKTDGITSKGLASKVIGRLLTRMKSHLATPQQLSLMKQLGLDEETCATLTIQEATATIDATLKAKRGD